MTSTSHPLPSDPRPARPPAGSTDAALHSLLPYLGALVLACLALQVTIALTGGRIALLAALLTAVIAAGAAIYLGTRGRALGRLRFGLLIAHALLYVSVNGSFALHAFVRSALGEGLDPSWGGPMLAMPGIWALGFLTHAAGSLAGRGFEAGRA
ncbi:hypothetical protein [Brachybacterium phenoliresistens]|uniref:hypothetical protein n=1 Tax=Brachybacterium phenoliresistens TaxID=396014 RepID=UPI0031DE6EB3